MARNRPFLGITAAVVVALALAACGGSKSSSSSSAAAPASSGASGSASSSSGAAGTSGTASSSGASGASGASTSSGSSGAAAGASSTLSDSADPSGQLKFTSSSLTAKAGTVTVNFTNSSSVGHNFTIADSSGKVVGQTPTFTGGSKSFSANLKPGTYTFYCSVPGHEAAGMKGTITVS